MAAKQEHQLVPVCRAVKAQHTCRAHLGFELNSLLGMKNNFKMLFILYSECLSL